MMQSAKKHLLFLKIRNFSMNGWWAVCLEISLCYCRCPSKRRGWMLLFKAERNIGYWMVLLEDNDDSRPCFLFNFLQSESIFAVVEPPFVLSRSAHFQLVVWVFLPFMTMCAVWKHFSQLLKRLVDWGQILDWNHSSEGGPWPAVFYTLNRSMPLIIYNEEACTRWANDHAIVVLCFW